MDVDEFDDPAQQWDNTEPVTYTSTRKTGSMAASIAIARKRSVTLKEQAVSGGVYQGSDIVFLLPGKLLSPSLGQLKEADVVTDRDGIAWTVLSAQGQRRGLKGYAVWRLTCRALAIVYDLRDLATFERYMGVLDPAGIEVKAWRPVPNGAGVSCRVQRISDQQAEERGIRGNEVLYEIYLAAELDLTVKDRVNWPAALGGYLEVRSIKNRQRIDELSVVEAVQAV